MRLQMVATSSMATDMQICNYFHVRAMDVGVVKVMHKAISMATPAMCAWLSIGVRYRPTPNKFTTQRIPLTKPPSPAEGVAYVVVGVLSILKDLKLGVLWHFWGWPDCQTCGKGDHRGEVCLVRLTLRRKQ